jgi:hypothetical protein
MSRNDAEVSDDPCIRHCIPMGVPSPGSSTEPESVVPRQRPSSTRDPDRRPAVLVTIHGRVWPGTLRSRSWSEEHQDWRCSVEIRVDDRAVVISVPPDQVEFVDGPTALGY